MDHRGMRLVCGLMVGLAALLAQPASAGSKSVAEEILDVLHENGQIDDRQYQDLLRKARDEEAVRGATGAAGSQHALPKFTLFGDLRARHESFWFNRDDRGVERDDRYRIRYRVRIGTQVTVNDRASVVLRLASGGDRRSSNQTLGAGPDGGFFDPDSIFIDRAFVRLRPLGEAPFDGGRLDVEFGRVPNPFVGKVGKDFLLWDHDVVLEGASLNLASRIGGSAQVYAHTGYYILDENSKAKDPHLVGAQAGFVAKLSDAVELGGRASGFFFASLNPDFMARSVSRGNLLAGLTGDPGGRNLRAGELFGYLRCGGSDTWPVTVYGTLAQNFDAVRIAGASPEDVAFGLGVELGDAKKLLKLGAGYFHVEANAFPAIFVDSDLFDEFTNRKGFVFYGARRVWKHTDFKLTLFVSDDIENGPLFATSVADADRYRLQTDLVLKF